MAMKTKLPVSAIAWLFGLFALFMGQRVLLGGNLERIVSLLGLLGLGGATILQAHRLRRSEDPLTAHVHRTLALAGVLGLFGILLCSLTTDRFLGVMPWGEDGSQTWTRILGVTWPILLLIATLVVVMVDVAHAQSSRLVQPARIRHVRDTAILIGLAIALVFPANYLAIQKNQRWDLTYFKTTEAGSATLNLVAGLQEPVTVRIFQEPGSEVTSELTAYFEPLASPMLIVEVIDHAAEPLLVEQLDIPDNGYVALSVEPTRSGSESEQEAEDSPKAPQTESFQVSGDWDRAKRTLKRLDAEFHQALAEITKGERTLYLSTGHGELPLQGGKTPERKMSNIKKELQARGFTLKNLDRADLLDQVPEDAGVLMILGPRDPFVQAELNSVSDFMDRGGAVLLSLEPDMKNEPPRQANLLDLFGLEQENGVIASDRGIIPRPPFPRPRQADRINIISGTFSSHPMTSTLSESAGSKKAGILFPRASAITKNSDFEGKQTVTLRSRSDAWMDMDGDLNLGEDEKKSVRNLATAIESGNEIKPWRAVVLTSTEALSDFWTRLSGGTRILMGDSVAWLVGEEAETGEVLIEEDPKIVHKSEDDILWFYGSVIFIPMLVFLAGMLRLRRRNNNTAMNTEGEA
jgi:hypothetical protein